MRTDFAPDLSETLNKLVDAALEDENAKQPPRNYLGGSRLGEACGRKLYYEWKRQAPDADKTPIFDGKALRRFRLGHLHEDETARWLVSAGFDLRTFTEDGGQYTFGDPDAPISGHIDGVILSGPLELPYPLIWEHKIMKDSKWSEFTKKGLKESNWTYWVQVHTYMGWSSVGNALFTALNTDTSRLAVELVKFDDGVYRVAIDRGRNVVTAPSADAMPRVSLDPNDTRCKWCPYRKTCWAPTIAAPKPDDAPPWRVDAPVAAVTPVLW